jgi:hypothetical protein
MFTQQHYEALAKVLKETRIRISQTQTGSVSSIHDMQLGVNEVQLTLMQMLKLDNPKFRELIFIGAASEHAPDPKRKGR